MFLATLSNCGGETMNETVVPPATPLSISDRSLAGLAEQRVFFAHQSVGWNIIQGIETWMTLDSRVRLRIVESTDPQSAQGPAFVHAPVGENGKPTSKMAEFSAILARGMGQSGGIALLKFCYLDFQPSTDVDALFGEYRREVAALRAAYPALRIAHVTAPLTADENPLRIVAKRILGRPTSRDLNAKRNRYNRLLLGEYGASGTVFDLAATESTRPDGQRQFVRVQGDTVYTLARQLTSDGGHLNHLGRRLVAARFLAFLASLPTDNRPR